MALLARKLEMTRVVKGDRFVPVTLLQVPALKVVSIKTEENDGYNALVVGITTKEETSLDKDKKALNSSKFSIIREFALKDADLEKYKVGDDITLDSLEGVVKVNVESFSKGKGFTGAMKKHNFHGGPGGHGSKFHRALGSIGNRKPTRTHKGKKMHGHHGDIKKTLRDVTVEIVNKEMGIIGLRGPVPGARRTLVQISF